MIENKNTNRKVIVCDKCFQASCWQGVFMCDDARIAGTIDKTINELIELGIEHPSYWEIDNHGL